MSGKCPSVWISMWRSFKWPFRTGSPDAAQAVAEPPTAPLPVQATPAHEAVDLVEGVARAVAELPPITPPRPVQVDPTFDFEAVEPGLDAVQVLARLCRHRSTNPARATVDLSSIALPLPVEANPASEATEPGEAEASLQGSHATADFALPARLAIVAKLNVASARRPRYRPYGLPAGKAVPLPAKVRSVYVRRPPHHLEAQKPTMQRSIQKRTTPAPALVIDLDVVRKVVQSSPIAKRAA